MIIGSRDKMKFYHCKHCGNVVIQLEEDHHLCCCDEAMEELVPGSIEGAPEKHIPVIRNDHEITVTVGSILHPMSEDHQIKWILLELEKGFMITYLDPNDEAEAKFQTNQVVKNVYAYCNLHGLWKKEM